MRLAEFFNQLVEEGGLADAATGEGAPSTTVPKARLAEGWPLLDAMKEVGLSKSKGDARRLVRGGGAYVNGERVEDEGRTLTEADIQDDHILLRSGKKSYHRIDVSP